MNKAHTILFCWTLWLLPGPLGASGEAGEEYTLETIGERAADQAAERPPAGTELPPEGTELPPEGTELPPEGTELPPEGTELPPEGTELPKEIPEPFRSELIRSGLRLSKVGGRPLYDLWLRKRVPLQETGSKRMSVNYGQIQIGTFVGVLRAYGRELDYREDPVDSGFFLLRYGIQPEDGDHMGTAESRDFLVLTRFKEDRRLEPVTDMEELIDLALAASAAGDHPMILYLARASTAAYQQPRIYRHAERDEWIADLRLAARVGAEQQDTSLRLGLVLVGVSEHF